MGRKRKAANRYLPPYMHEKGGRFYLFAGKPRRWTKLADNYRDALIEYSRRMPMPGRGTTFAELARQYQLAEFPKLAPATQASYSLALENLIRAFGDAPVHKIRAVDVGRYMDVRSSKHSANREKAVMSKILELGIRWGWCEGNVARKISYHAYERRRRIITRSEWRKIQLAAIGDLVPVFMDLAFVTGLRVGDVLALRWDQVSEEGLRVLQSKNRVEGVYELTDTLAMILDRAKQLHGRKDVAILRRPETRIIHTRQLKPYTYYGFRSIWRTTIERAGLEDIHIHDIRRTAITAAKACGIRPIDFSLHRTEKEANAYVIEIPKVRPLELMK